MTDEGIIEYQLAALMRVVVSVFAFVGLVPGGPVVSALSVEVRRRVLRILQPAESALRRAIYLKARGLMVAPGRKRTPPTHPIPKGNGSADRIPAFVLFDPRKWFRELAKKGRPPRGPGPRISGFDEERPVFDPPKAHSSDVKPESLCKRLQALHKALGDVPAQARRLARLQAKRRAAGEPQRRTRPLRPGLPPGYRTGQTDKVDEILHDLHLMALREPRPPERV